jgi:hypothetical protein
MLKLVEQFGAAAQGDPDRLAYAVRRLRAFLTGCGASVDYIDHAARLLVDTYVGGEVR